MKSNQAQSHKNDAEPAVADSPADPGAKKAAKTIKQSKRLEDPVSSFHPVIQTWFRRRFHAPTDAQAAGWPIVKTGRDVLIAAPTGSGKTLAAFLAGIDNLIRQADAGELGQQTQLVYISPLKALGNDIQRNLEAPLKELEEVAAELGYVTLSDEEYTAERRSRLRKALKAADAASDEDTGSENDSTAKLRVSNLQSPMSIQTLEPPSTPEAPRKLWPRIRVGLRTGDTPQKERQGFIKNPPHIMITTPESLYLMLTAARARETLRHVRTVIIDEIHALARAKRGSHLSLTMARLDHVCEQRPARIGLSATQRPIEEIAAFLVGTDHVTRPVDPGDDNVPTGLAEGFNPQNPNNNGQNIVSTTPRSVIEIERPDLIRPNCAIVDLGHQRDLDLHIEVPPADLEAVAAGEQWGDIYDRLAGLIRAHKTTLVFVNTRRLSERVAHQLSQRLGEDHVASHHGSLSRERRLRVEQRLKAGDLQALVCTASLELGIDIGSIDLVCQVGSPRGVATFLQRVGRSGHALGLRPQGRLFPSTRDELVECAALVRAVRGGRLDRVNQPVAPLDIMAQQIVAEASCEDWTEDDMFALVRRSWQFRDLKRQDFDDIVDMLGDGVGEGAGRAPPLLHRDRINGVLRGRRGARMSAILNGGAIPEMADYNVVAEPDDVKVGTVNEDFAIESMAGDIFLLGTHSWRIKRVGQGEVRVEDARGAPPTIPFWLGESPGRTKELSAEVGALRRDVVESLGDEQLVERLQAECGLSELASVQIIDYLRASRDSLGVMPSELDVVFERFFDETGGMQLIVHAPFGARINRAWGLTLRKRFCVRFDFELQAAASDDSIVLSLGPQHSFPLEESFDYVTSRNAEQSLRQAVLYAPVFPVRWRWDAGRALAVPRFSGARKVPPPIQRMRADDLLASVFPAQVGCQENVSGPLEIPDHPLIKQTMHDCMHEAMDIDGLVAVLQKIESGEIRMHARDTLEPSPMAHEILNGKPYTYLDDAPLEERRTRAVTMRRSLPESSKEIGALDIDAIDRVRDEAWPQPRDTEETHDALLSLVAVPAADAVPWHPFVDDLIESGRAAKLTVTSNRQQVTSEGTGSSSYLLPVTCYFAAENLRLITELYPDATIEPSINPPENALVRIEDRDEARAKLLRGWTEAYGPLAPSKLGEHIALRGVDLERGLRQLESLGFVLRGKFTPGIELAEDEDEYCDRRLLARVHRYTLDRLRREIDPVSQQDFMRFLLRWQHLAPDSKLQGKQGVRQAIARLAGFEAAAGSWESELLAARVSDYRPSWLDELCLQGEIAWARLTPRKAGGAATATATRLTPVTLSPRPEFATVLSGVRGTEVPEGPKTGAAAEILDALSRRGALFFDEIVNATRRIKTDVERGLRELVAWGLVTSDGFQGLRQLAGKQAHKGRARARESSQYSGGFFSGSGPAGRWALVHAPDDDAADDRLADELAEAVARVLLRRYGAVFRDLYVRESFTIPWRNILRALRRLEARGLVRGGRFVTGPSGEQYALPEAVDALRAVRRIERKGDRVWVSAVDAVNLVGVLIETGATDAGAAKRVPAQPGKGVMFIDGLPQLGAVQQPVAMKTPVPSKGLERLRRGLPSR